MDVDIKNGALRGVGYDKNGNKYHNHPVSKIRLSDFKLPNWDILKAEVNNVCSVYTMLPLLGLDVVITNEGVKILELNAGFNTLGIQFVNQLYDHPGFNENLRY